MDFLVWRHADAAPGQPDNARPLTSLGIAQAEFISAWIKDNVPGPYRVFGSSALRARDTAAALTTQYEASDLFAYQVLTATASRVLEFANWPNATMTTIFVGHQPTVGRINSFLHFGIEVDTNMEWGSLWWFSSDHDNQNRLAILKAVVSANTNGSNSSSFCKV
jgi:phosphohistidine phosphatase